MTSPKDPGEDFVAMLMRIFDECSGGIEAQVARQIEDQIRGTFGSQAVYVHRAGWFDREQRNAQIRADKTEGASLRELARRYTLSVSTVQAICKGDDAR